MSFPAFPRQSLEFLQGISINNNKAWFEAHRADYDTAYVGAGKAFVAAAGEVLTAIAPEIQAQPKVNGSIFRINRDIRFAADKRPYKDHLDFWFWEGQRAGAVSGFFARLTPDTFGIGVGCHGFDKARLATFRSRLSQGLDQVASEISGAGYALEGQHYTRVPTGMDERAPGGAFARHGALFVHVECDAEVALDGDALQAACTTHWQALAPLHRWLIDQVQNG
ncbi:MAG: DUF2461 domain-containing protein [Acidimicrobiales bacterium]